MAFKKLEYQDEAVEELYKKTLKILKYNALRSQTKIVFKAPTGAGKTVVVADYLRKMVLNLPNEEAELIHRRFAYVWIAPNTLHEQSYASLKRAFQDDRLLHPVQFDDVKTEGYLRENEILFFNWQSITGKNRVVVKENEMGQYLPAILEQTRAKGIELIAILDEAHLFATNGVKADEALKVLQATIEIDVSATPLFKSDGFTVEIMREEVRKVGMIKNIIKLNKALDQSDQNDNFDIFLLEEALKKRQHLTELYQKESKDGVVINPLLLIQLPTDSEKESALDTTIKEKVLRHLNEQKGINVANGKLAVWLSKEKENVPNDSTSGKPITDLDSSAEVLLFKQAIALGWDCPRAAILLIYRELTKFEFTVQTVGRIMRMPEQRHYGSTDLNDGYVFTNLSRDLITIVKDQMIHSDDEESSRRADYKDTGLISHTLTMGKATGLFMKSDFYAHFDATITRFWQITGDEYGRPSDELVAQNVGILRGRFFDFETKNFEITVMVDKEFRGDENELIQAQGGVKKFYKEGSEIKKEVEKFCKAMCSPYQKDRAYGFIYGGLIRFLESSLGYFEVQAQVFILRNQTKFAELLSEAVRTYVALKPRPTKTERKLEAARWEVPSRLYFDSETNEKFPQFKAAAMTPQYLRLRQKDPKLFADSDTEFTFIQKLETPESRNVIEWWHKNGGQGSEHFSICYKNKNGENALFYVDFVIRFKNGTIGLFDTKTEGSDPEMENKHNALIEYLADQNKQGGLFGKLIGSIVVPTKEGVWLYCPREIADDDISSWSVLDFNNLRG